MTRIQSLEKARSSIESWFSKQPGKIYRYSELRSVFHFQSQSWGLNTSVVFEDFLDYYKLHSNLKVVSLEFPRQPIVLIYWDAVKSPFELALALGPEAYLSHYSAIFLHELTEQIPKTVYVTVPQPRKSDSNVTLTQEQIDAAFSKAFRETSMIADLGDYRIAMLTGMESGGVGIEPAPDTPWGDLRMTSLERTLIDAVVRPTYCGGLDEVLQAYERARGRVSTNQLVAELKKLNFVYPYHQAIGFCLERTGYNENVLRLVENMGMTRDFYLDRGLNKPAFSQRWRLFIPQWLQ